MDLISRNKCIDHGRLRCQTKPFLPNKKSNLVVRSLTGLILNFYRWNSFLQIYGMKRSLIINYSSEHKMPEVGRTQIATGS